MRRSDDILEIINYEVLVYGVFIEVMEIISLRWWDS